MVRKEEFTLFLAEDISSPVAKVRNDFGKRYAEGDAYTDGDDRFGEGADTHVMPPDKKYLGTAEPVEENVRFHGYENYKERAMTHLWK